MNYTEFITEIGLLVWLCKFYVCNEFIIHECLIVTLKVINFRTSERFTMWRALHRELREISTIFLLSING